VAGGGLALMYGLTSRYENKVARQDILEGVPNGRDRRWKPADEFPCPGFGLAQNQESKRSTKPVRDPTPS
jgi:hypothetical protein